MKPRTDLPLTHKRLTEVLEYNPATGIFTWLKTLSNRCPAGSVAGCWDHRPGKQHCWITIDGERYSAHRLAWLYMTRRWPKNELDHRNLDQSDNSWANLRECTHQENVRNVAQKRHNKSGFKGVHRHPLSPNKFVAQITINGRPQYLGLFNSPEEAHEAYAKASRRHHGEFGRPT